MKVQIPVVHAVVLFRSRAYGTYSANGEDLLIKALVPDCARLWYVDIGAGHPKVHSNTYGFYRAGASGLAVDANRGLLEEFGRVRPRDATIWGAITRTSHRGGTVTYWQLDPWELSTTHPTAMQDALKNGGRVVSTSPVPAIGLNEILASTFPADGRPTLLNVDVEGISYDVLNSVNFSRFPFDYVLVERISRGYVLRHGRPGRQRRLRQARVSRPNRRCLLEGGRQNRTLAPQPD